MWFDVLTAFMLKYCLVLSDCWIFQWFTITNHHVLITLVWACLFSYTLLIVLPCWILPGCNGFMINNVYILLKYCLFGALHVINDVSWWFKIFIPHLYFYWYDHKWHVKFILQFMDLVSYICLSRVCWNACFWFIILILYNFFLFYCFNYCVYWIFLHLTGNLFWITMCHALYLARVSSFHQWSIILFFILLIIY